MEGLGGFVKALMGSGKKKKDSGRSKATDSMTGVDSARKQKEGRPVVGKAKSMKEQDKALGGKKKNETLSKVGKGLKSFGQNSAANRHKAQQISSRISSRRGRNLIDLR